MRARIELLAVERNNKKNEKGDYFIKISCKIEELMWMFYIDGSVK